METVVIWYKQKSQAKRHSIACSKAIPDNKNTWVLDSLDIQDLIERDIVILDCPCVARKGQKES